MSGNKEKGIKAENFFIETLNKNGLHLYDYKDDWYDFEVLGEKVEVKSCRISVKQPRKNGKDQYRIGRFDFTNPDNREKQYEENVWICFIARHGDSFMELGMCRAREVDRKRYVSLHKIRDLNLIPVAEFIKKASK